MPTLDTLLTTKFETETIDYKESWYVSIEASNSSVIMDELP